MLPLSDMRMRNVLAPGAPQQQSQSGGIDLSTTQPLTAEDILNVNDAAKLGAQQPINTRDNNVPPLSHEMQQKLQQALDMMPRRGDYKPTTFRKIMSSLASLDAKDPMQQQQVIDQIQYKPYYQDMDDWMTHVRALMQGATEEDRANVNLRILGLTGRKLDQGDIRLGQQQETADAMANRQRAYADHLKWLDTHPKFSYRPIPGGNVIGFNSVDPTDTSDTGISSGLLTSRQLENLKQGGRVALETMRGIIAENVARIRGEQARQTKQTPTGKAETPQERRIRYLNRAIQGVNKHPEWKDYIRFTRDSGTGNNDFEINPPREGNWFKDARTKELHDEIYSYIYGSENAGQQEVPPTTQPQSPLRDPGGVRPK